MPARARPVALLALVRERLWDWMPSRRFLSGARVAVLPVVILAAGSLPWWGDWVRPRTAWFLTGVHAAVGITLLNVALAMLIDRVVRFPDGPSGWFLNLRGVTFLGALSYSVYIWQLLCHLAVRCLAHTGATVARFLGVTTSAVNRAAWSAPLPELAVFT